MIYLAVLLLLAILSFHYDVNGRRVNRVSCYRIMLMAFILIAGLRWRIGIDTPQYLYTFYHEIPLLDKFSWQDYPIGTDPFWVLINSIVKTLGGRFYIVQLIQATIVNTLIFHYIRKHSDSWFTCLFFYAIICYTTYNMEIMRGGLSVVICLYANDYVLNKQWIKGYFLYTIALMFHAQTLVLFLLPFFFFLRFNKLGLIACVGAFLIGMIVMNIFSDYIFLFEASEELQDKVSGYAGSEKYGDQGGNLNFFVINILPMLMYVVVSFLSLKYFFSDSRLLKFEPLILFGVMFILVRVNLEIAYRYVDYYKIYFVLVFSELFVRIIKEARLLTPALASFRALVLFMPLLLVLLLYNYVLSKDYSLRYTPYSSVFDRTVYKERELMYKELNASKSFYPSATINEY